MDMDITKESEITNYIEKKEREEWFSGLLDLIWEKEAKEWILFNWLKNDNNLLEYAELTMKAIVDENWKISNFNFWERFKYRLLELKLSITCPYFDDFKIFIEEIKRWTDTSTTTDNPISTPSTETWNTGTVPVWTTSNWTTTTTTVSETSETMVHTFCWTNVSSIKSEPFEKNSQTGVTWCSKTARWNGRNFGIELPSWDAYKAGTRPWKDSIQTIPQDKINEKPENTWIWIDSSKFDNTGEWNFADIYTNSKSKYGHRAAAFKDDNWQWYVLDPYTGVNWMRADTSPKKLEDYLKARKIVKAHIYESKWYKQNNPDIYDDTWKGYEWKNH